MGKQKERGWVTVSQLADVLGISTQAIYQSYIPKLAPEHVRKGDRQKPTQAYGPAVVALLVEREAQARSNGDADMAGDSPNLERYRLAKAKLAELELLERMKTLQPASWWRSIADASLSAMSRIPVMVRRMPIDFQREYEDAIGECMRELEQRFRLPSNVARCELHTWVEGGSEPVVTLLPPPEVGIATKRPG